MSIKLAVISDVHGNLEALLACLTDIGRRGVDEIWFAGDAVGYGPAPNECMNMLRKACTFFIAGNHDHGAVGLTDINSFNRFALAAIMWTTRVLTQDNKDYLMSAPLTSSAHNITMAHGSPYEPYAFHYITTNEELARGFRSFTERICFVGHTHVPFIAEKKDKSVQLHTGKDLRVKLAEGTQYLVNNGSVGQPRDRDPRASYALLTPLAIEIVRVEYDIEATQRKMRELELPEPLIDRLTAGK